MNYTCVYCGESHNSRNGTGSDVSCCGEVGHSMAERVNVPYREFCRHPEKCGRTWFMPARSLLRRLTK